jgi:hypothetical protein
MTDVDMVSLNGWDFVFPLRRPAPALPILVVAALPLIASEVGWIVAAFSQTPRDFDTLLTAAQRQIFESGSGQIASPLRV